MSYTPTTWTSGDIVTSAKLNKIENGIVEASSSGGCEVINGHWVEYSTSSEQQTKTAVETLYYLEFPISYAQAYQKLSTGTLLFFIIPENLNTTFSAGGYLCLNYIIVPYDETYIYFSLATNQNTDYGLINSNEYVTMNKPVEEEEEEK